MSRRRASNNYVTILPPLGTIAEERHYPFVWYASRLCECWKRDLEIASEFSSGIVNRHRHSVYPWEA